MYSHCDGVATKVLQNVDVDKTILADLIFHVSTSHAGIREIETFIFSEHILI